MGELCKYKCRNFNLSQYTDIMPQIDAIIPFYLVFLSNFCLE